MMTSNRLETEDQQSVLYFVCIENLLYTQSRLFQRDCSCMCLAEIASSPCERKTLDCLFCFWLSLHVCLKKLTIKPSLLFAQNCFKRSDFLLVSTKMLRDLSPSSENTFYGPNFRDPNSDQKIPRYTWTQVHHVTTEANTTWPNVEDKHQAVYLYSYVAGQLPFLLAWLFYHLLDSRTHLLWLNKLRVYKLSAL